ncbi:isochorismatase family protein [Solihabitans fulvus]|uniref:Isochorismatase family protein n=1 Tax=Solihabitans fulvus TaxID=1892852 RepID=A0A5B2X125_9PSEU|nr:isochorismatase family protein [Solihabitans fulvus]KAA2256726.1 isochorismatase family protein [Solihabitans fulvus]
MRRALLVVDAQESFRQRPNWAVVSQPRIAEQIGVLVDAARAAGDLVVWVLHTEPGTGTVFDPALGHVRLLDGLARHADEPLLTKTVHNPFTGTNLQHLLTVDGVRELTVCGIRTEQCCETTTRVGSDLGYDMTFVTDATATHPIPHRDRGLREDHTVEELFADPRTLRVEEIIERTEYALAGRFATIATVAEVTAVR